jgi:hypothetical protein
MAAYQGREMINRRRLIIALGTGAFAAPLACFPQYHALRVHGSVLASADKVIE